MFHCWTVYPSYFAAKFSIKWKQNLNLNHHQIANFPEKWKVKKNLARTGNSQATNIHDVNYWYIKVRYLGWYFYSSWRQNHYWTFIDSLRSFNFILNYICIGTIICIGYTSQILFITTCLFQTKKGIKKTLYALNVCLLFPAVISCLFKSINISGFYKQDFK